MSKLLRSIAGVAVMTFRALVRTKTVWAVAALLAVVVIALPLVIVGDGTPEGSCRILLSYTLNSAFVLLGLATLLAACGLFAEEIDSARLQLEWVKPVRIASLWIGKWLALAGLDLLFLLAVYAGVYAQLRLRLARHPAWQPRVVLASRHVTHPVLPPLAEEARNLYAELKAKNQLPKEVNSRQLLRVLTERAFDRYDVINPGVEVPWRFRLDRPVAPGGLFTVRIRFDTEFSTRAEVKGTCRLRAEGGSGAAVEVELDDLTQSEIEFDVDARLFGMTPEGRHVAPPSGGWRDFELSFLHRGNANKTSGLMLRPRQDVVLLTPAWPFEVNLAQAAVRQLGVLAALAALGLALGACFSLPVAVFTAVIILILTQVSRSVVQVISLEEEKEPRNRVGVAIVRSVNGLTRYADTQGALTALTRGEAIEPGPLAFALAWNAGVIPFLLLLFSVAALSRRELAE